MEKYYMTDLMEVVNRIRFPRNMGGLTTAELEEIYGIDDFKEVLKLDVVTLIEKYKKWENGYRKGEIVSTPDGHFGVVTYVNEKGEPHILQDNGMAKYYNNAKLVRIGKKMNVAKFLHEMKEIAVPKTETQADVPDGVFAIKIDADADKENFNLFELLKAMM